MKKINSALNILMGSVTGLYLGHVLFVLWNRIAHPGRYAFYSAPWYTSILVYGVLTLAALALCLAAKGILRLCLRKAEKSRRDTESLSQQVDS